jgi:hypothetical protein
MFHPSRRKICFNPCFGDLPETYVIDGEARRSSLFPVQIRLLTSMLMMDLRVERDVVVVLEALEDLDVLERIQQCLRARWLLQNMLFFYLILFYVYLLFILFQSY